MSHTEELVQKLKSEPDMVLVVQRLKQEMAIENNKRQEFYDLLHEKMKAEFINGEIVMHSPVKSIHWQISMELSATLHQFVKNNDLGRIGVEKVMINLTRNDYEPDIVYFSKDKAKEFTDNQMLFPVPDLAVEILSPSSIVRDREIKFIDYAAHGVYEYWIVDPENKCLEQYVLRNGEYYILGTHKSGKFRTDTIKGLEIDMDLIFKI